MLLSQVICVAELDPRGAELDRSGAEGVHCGAPGDPWAAEAANRATDGRRSRQGGSRGSGSLPLAEEAEAGDLLDVPRAGHVGFAGRGRLVELAETLEEGLGEGVAVRQDATIV
jgi:hypothetical protein